MSVAGLSLETRTRWGGLGYWAEGRLDEAVEILERTVDRLDARSAARWGLRRISGVEGELWGMFFYRVAGGLDLRCDWVVGCPSLELECLRRLFQKVK